MSLSAEQANIRVVIQRAGTSRGLFVHESDLPPSGPVRDRLLARLMGSPDVLQIDGLGGSRAITSKMAIIAVSNREDADIDYTFAQIDPASGYVGYQGNCGNISSGVGPFALDEGLVAMGEHETTVRIYNTNTDKVLIAIVPVVEGRAAIEGGYVVPGVPRTGAEIKMNWRNTVGAKSGRLLPTHRPLDTITMNDGRPLDASLVDAGNPCVWMRAADFGLTGAETAEHINTNEKLLADVAEARRHAAVLAGFADDPALADQQSPGLPMLGLVSPPVTYQTINGVNIRVEEMDVRLHLIFLGALHESVAGTGSVCFAAVSRTPGTIVNDLTLNTSADFLRLGHASGVTPTRVKAHAIDKSPFVAFDELGFSRTSRRIMEGIAFYPRDLL